MKRKLSISLALLLALVSLAACSNSAQESSSTSRSDRSSKTSKKSNTSPEIKKVSGSKTMEIKGRDTSGQEALQRQTISYDGDDYTSVKVNIDENLPEDIKSQAAGMDFNQAKAALLKALDEDESIKQMKQMKGTTVTTDISQDYHLKIEVTFDMKKADRQELSKVEGIGVDFDTMLTYTPLEYLLKLDQSGATKVN